MEGINVKGTMEQAAMPVFIEGQKADASAAFERLKIIRKAHKDIKRAINDTNTVDIIGEHKNLYGTLDDVLNAIALHEQVLISQGE